MKVANIVVMGKTGTGKSTLINSILGSDEAPTGIGQAITKRNEMYTFKYSKPIAEKGECTKEITINLYDTVGLEVDNEVTNETLRDIKGILTDVEKNKDAKTIVWFCVGSECSRFEKYEVELIRQLSIEYEIPFVIVLTKCFAAEVGDLEEQIQVDLPEVSLYRILAKDYKTRTNVVNSYGVKELLNKTIEEYKESRTKLLESKLELLLENKNDKVFKLRKNAETCIQKYSDKASKAARIPLGCIPVIHGLCAKMISEINELLDIHDAKELSSDIIVNVVVGALVTPMMAIPGFSIIAATSYIETAGEQYLKTLMSIVEKSTLSELRNSEAMIKRIKEELLEK